ncbi:hypothetical protein B0A48_00775 [Cryoendolithus antarcticus]|uniref:Uncharacterized protein n=1 Tax=Cryoendolithus antarcticus TaxID=1507870 RepID=A0A1V8TR92_9PEZI|nr:hypothetical protein B0A48_00775 [Cryoendolithus antarcticus]
MTGMMESTDGGGVKSTADEEGASGRSRKESGLLISPNGTQSSNNSECNSGVMQQHAPTMYLDRTLLATSHAEATPLTHAKTHLVTTFPQDPLPANTVTGRPARTTYPSHQSSQIVPSASMYPIPGNRQDPEEMHHHPAATAFAPTGIVAAPRAGLSDHPMGHSTSGTMLSGAQGLGLGLGLNGGTMGGTSSDTPKIPAQTQDHSDDEPQWGSLRKRRQKASPEKFNTGQFEPLPMRKDQDASQHAEKRLRASDGTSIPVITPINSLTSTLNHFSIATPQQKSSQLTGALAGLGFDIPIAYTVPMDALFAKPCKPISPPKAIISNLLDALCQHNDLLLLLTSYLNIPALINLYAMHKPFHHTFNCHHTAFILAIMRTWAPNADRIFPWRTYQKLCVKDPRQRQKSRLLGKEGRVRYQHEDLRDVPSLRWLQMVIYREGMCRDIVITLAQKGLRCPYSTSVSLKRTWFLLDLPLNAHRIALIRSPTYFPAPHLRLLTHFFIKLDMHLTDPIGGTMPANHPDQLRFPNHFARQAFTGKQLRETLLGEKSLTPLWRVVRGWSPDPGQPRVVMDRLDMLKLWVRHYYKRPEGQNQAMKNQKIMGVPWWECGTAGLERVGQPYVKGEGTRERPWVLVKPGEVHRRPDPLLRPDQLVMREGVRREMGLHHLWVRMMTWGFYDARGRKIVVRREK